MCVLSWLINCNDINSELFQWNFTILTYYYIYLLIYLFNWLSEYENKKKSTMNELNTKMCHEGNHFKLIKDDEIFMLFYVFIYLLQHDVIYLLSSILYYLMWFFPYNRPAPSLRGKSQCSETIIIIIIIKTQRFSVNVMLCDYY